ncbi:hypothetical protein AXW37_07135 [Yersinia ruckeri]|uniref:HP1 family phage holin n=1 Tax=Yersinia ruckeri TaxID=29486 RepID=UPI000537FD5D|nr:HP1 family phage holin [Yersinia ruckeri]AKA37433.1 primosomal protein [Yersinia ruckeri]AUQ42804.1 hypothetical protein NJ56_13340 [Yersinia ruckeri]EKN3361002.1 hypothetical protein [Yersinia ruckeri]EKN4199053.1 hypothetical protein [Yersinia ruckeri]EKN4200799.1 hypothetical protein [Yersinia ruckeri]
MEKLTSDIAYFFALMLAFIGAMSPQDIAFYVAALAATATSFVNWYYRRKNYLLLKKLGLREVVINEFNR